METKRITTGADLCGSQEHVNCGYASAGWSADGWRANYGGGILRGVLHLPRASSALARNLMWSNSMAAWRCGCLGEMARIWTSMAGYIWCTYEIIL